MAQSITLNSISKSYGEGDEVLQVIDGISFDVAENEFVTLVGPSGCGKTTLLKMVNGLIEPTEGSVRVGDKAVTEPTTDVAMVFQQFQLYPWRSVLDNVALGLEIQNVKEAERYERARKWIDTVGLNGFEDSLPNELSGGMQQRVGLARALVVDPDVLLMDEPFGALDAQTKDKMQTELLRLLEQQNKTILFITHDIDEAIFLADRVLVMSAKPAKILRDIEIDFERPRWNRRLEIERDDRFNEIERTIREDLGLNPEEKDQTLKT